MKHLLQPGMILWAEVLFCEQSPENVSDLIEAGKFDMSDRWHLVKITDRGDVLLMSHPEAVWVASSRFRFVLPSEGVHILRDGNTFLGSYHLDVSRQSTCSPMTEVPPDEGDLPVFFATVAAETHCSVIAFNRSYYLARY